MPRRDDLLDTARAAADAASKVILAAPRNSVEAESKSQRDWVTQFDREAEQAALRVLRDRTPDIDVVAEETGGTKTDRFWAIDPLDGTTNFVCGSPIVAVSIALMEGGRPVAGVVNAPFLNASWFALEGEGAFDGKGNHLDLSRMATKEIVATGFPFRRRDRLPEYMPVLQRVFAENEDVRRLGAAALDLTFVAAGTWIGYFELGLEVWDVAAGALIVREAGGVVTDWNGDPAGFLESGDVLAGAPAWHERTLDLIRQTVTA